MIPESTIYGSGGPSSCDITIHVNRDPDCSQAQPELHTLPNNHHYFPVLITGVTDPDGDPVTICITGVTSDEQIAGGVCPDAIISGCSASLAGERNSSSNGRVYVVSFTATDAGVPRSSHVARCCGFSILRRRDPDLCCSR